MPTETDHDPDPETPPSPVVSPSKPRLLSILGPGLITGASDDDPSGIATYSQTGAQFGYGLTWTMLFSYPLMSAVQMISARIGPHHRARHRRQSAPALPQLAAARHGPASARRQHHQHRRGPRGHGRCDAPAARRPASSSTCSCSRGVCTALQIFLQYTRYVAVLKWLTLALFAYVATLFMVKVPWGEALTRLVVPQVRGARTSSQPSSRSSARQSAPTCSSGRPSRRRRTCARSRAERS